MRLVYGKFNGKYQCSHRDSFLMNEDIYDEFKDEKSSFLCSNN